MSCHWWFIRLIFILLYLASLINASACDNHSTNFTFEAHVMNRQIFATPCHSLHHTIEWPGTNFNTRSIVFIHCISQANYNYHFRCMSKFTNPSLFNVIFMLKRLFLIAVCLDKQTLNIPWKSWKTGIKSPKRLSGTSNICTDVGSLMSVSVPVNVHAAKRRIDTAWVDFLTPRFPFEFKSLTRTLMYQQGTELVYIQCPVVTKVFINGLYLVHQYVGCNFVESIRDLAISI